MIDGVDPTGEVRCLPDLPRDCPDVHAEIETQTIGRGSVEENDLVDGVGMEALEGPGEAPGIPSRAHAGGGHENRRENQDPHHQARHDGPGEPEAFVCPAAAEQGQGCEEGQHVKVQAGAGEEEDHRR